jgi:hypothetical protein
MRCRPCHRPVRPGQEARKRVEFWRQPDGSVKVFSDTVSSADGADGKLSEATGTLVAAEHSKCYFAHTKRERRAQAADPGSRPVHDQDRSASRTACVEEMLSAHDGDRPDRGAKACSS